MEIFFLRTVYHLFFTEHDDLPGNFDDIIVQRFPNSVLNAIIIESSHSSNGVFLRSGDSLKNHRSLHWFGSLPGTDLATVPHFSVPYFETALRSKLSSSCVHTPFFFVSLGNSCLLFICIVGILWNAMLISRGTWHGGRVMSVHWQRSSSIEGMRVLAITCSIKIWKLRKKKWKIKLNSMDLWNFFQWKNKELNAIVFNNWILI